VVRLETCKRRFEIPEIDRAILPRTLHKSGSMFAINVPNLKPFLAGIGLKCIPHDSEQPRAQPGTRLKAIYIRERLEQGLLHQIVGFGAIARKRPRE
jgi:hypothetical protein